MNRSYQTPTVAPEWAASRHTHLAVAVAIHAIADASRPPEAIWEGPTPTEFDHVRMAIDDYVEHGDFAYQPAGYQWGEETMRIAAPAGAQVYYSIVDHDGYVKASGLGLVDAAHAVMQSDGREWRIDYDPEAGEWAAWSRHQTAGRPWRRTGFVSYHYDEDAAREDICRQIVEAERMSGHYEAVAEPAK